MINTECGVVIEIWSHILFALSWRCIFMMFVLWSSTKYTPIQYRCWIKKSKPLTLVCLIKGQFRLRWRSATIKNVRGMMQYDWLQNGFFIARCLHYNQDFFGGEHQVWINKSDMVTNMATLLARGVLWRSSFLGNLKPSDKKLDLWATPTWGIFFNNVFPSCMPYQPMPQITLCWVEILDRLMDFFTLV